jgi:hypothetical protein
MNDCVDEVDNWRVVYACFVRSCSVMLLITATLFYTHQARIAGGRGGSNVITAGACSQLHGARDDCVIFACEVS